MGLAIIEWINEFVGVGESYRATRFARRNERELAVGLGFNIRDLGGYRAGKARFVRPHRFLRAGDTSFLDAEGISILRGYGVSRVLDLRGKLERPELTDVFARQPGVDWKNVALFDYDTKVEQIEPARLTQNFVAQNYLKLLSDKPNVAEAITFLAHTRPGTCALYHCAAGMDRTGIVSLLLLGAAGVSRRQIVCDYGYSFGTVKEIDKVFSEWDGTQHEGVDKEVFRRMEAIGLIYDTLALRFGGVREYLLDCGVSQETIDLLKFHMLDARG